MTWDQLPETVVIEKTAHALRANNIDVHIVENGNDAKEKALSLLPPNAAVMTMTSMTLEKTGITKAIEDGDYVSVRKKLTEFGHGSHPEKSKLGAAPPIAIGSVHAVTEDGQVLIASNTGSQLPAYAYGSQKVIWVVGAQKIVKNVDEAIKRIYEHALPLEDERAMKAYGTHSNVSKMLIVNKEVTKGRIHLILVKEKLGF